MTQRFQIEELIVQDASGVVFRALDTETNQPVAVRRFFPFGADGGGLRGDEQTAYNIAVERLAGISHPALRAIVCGGCDPNDGMPYIATEWIEGTRLQLFLDRAPLTPAEATNLLTLALEVCELLSQVLAEEAVWVETDLQSIVVGAEGSGRGITFWIAPLKWLGKNDGHRGLESIVSLTEDVMGWSGKSISDQAGRGLGGWLKWLRGKARTTTLLEAREMLAASIGVEPPLPAKHLVRQATRPLVIVKKKKSSGFPFLIAGTVALAVIALGGWALIHRNNSANRAMPAALQTESPEQVVSGASAQPSPVEASAPSRTETDDIAETEESPSPTEEPTVPGETPEQRASRRAAEITAAAQGTSKETEAKTVSRNAEIARRGGIFKPEDHELLVAQDDKVVAVEGTLEAIGYSKSRKTMYLQFSKNAPNTETRGAILIKSAPDDLSESKLAPLTGKKVRLRGKVQVDKLINRPVIVIENRSAIEVVE